MKTKNQEHFLFKLTLFLVTKGWKDEDAFTFIIISSLFMFSLFNTFIIGVGSYIIGLESAEQNVQILFIVNSLFFILSLGIYIIHLFEKKGSK